MNNFINIKAMIMALVLMAALINTSSGKSDLMLAAPNWSVNPAAYEHNMNLLGEVFGDNGTAFQGESSDLVAAFDANGNCVGLDNINTSQAANGEYRVYLTLFSNNSLGDVYTLKYYDASADEIIDIEEVVDFISNGVLGTFTFPHALNFAMMNPPTNLNVSQVSSPIPHNVLTWDDNSNNEAGFTIYRSDTPGQPYTAVGFVAANVSSFEDWNNINENTQYCYYVIAFDANGNGTTASNTACTTIIPPTPEAPVDLFLDLLPSNEAELNWNHNDPATVDEFIIMQQNGSNFLPLDTVSASVFTYTTAMLPFNSTECFRIVAVNAGGTSQGSNIVCANTPDIIAPNNLLADMQSETQVHLTWGNGATLITVSNGSMTDTLYNNYNAIEDFYAMDLIPGMTYTFTIENAQGTATITVTMPTGCGYSLMDTLYVECGTVDFCMGLKANTLPQGIIGFDFTLDPIADVLFSGITINTDAINPAWVSHNSFTLLDGSTNVSVFLTASAPDGTFFDSPEEIFCIDLSKDFNTDLADFTVSISDFRVSYDVYSIGYCMEDGLVIMDDVMNSEITGTLSRLSNNAPLQSASANVNTTVTGKVDCGDAAGVNADLSADGTFTYDANNGVFLNVERDIIGDEVGPTSPVNVMPIIGGYDAYLATRIVLGDPAFAPTLAEIIAADVNMDGEVTAGDISLIQQRSVNMISEYPQAWNSNIPNAKSRDWLFLSSDELGNPDNAISTSFPNDDNMGFSAGRVPTPSLCQEIPAEYSLGCATYQDMDLRGVLLGDIDGNEAAPNFPLVYKNSNLITFNLEHAIWEEAFCRIPVYASSIDDIFSIDFDLAYNAEEGINSAALEELVEYSSLVFNDSDGRILLSSYMTSPYPISDENSPLMYLIFNTTKEFIELSDFISFDAYINGMPVDYQIIDSPTTSIKETIDDLGIVSVFPNPTEDELHLNFELPLEHELEVQILSIDGKQLFAKESIAVGSNAATIYLGTLSNGIYMVSLLDESGQAVFYKKIVKQ